MWVEPLWSVKVSGEEVVRGPDVTGGGRGLTGDGTGRGRGGRGCSESQMGTGRGHREGGGVRKVRWGQVGAVGVFVKSDR